MSDTEKNSSASALKSLSALFSLALVLVLGLTLVVIYALIQAPPRPNPSAEAGQALIYTAKPSAAANKPKLWSGQALLPVPASDSLVRYGYELIANTSVYFGPKGKIKPLNSGLNCQNCHLEAGTKTFGNNYAATAANYPRFRARSGMEEDLPYRINECFVRSLNGQPLALDSREIQAMTEYIKYVGKGVAKGDKPAGSNMGELVYLDRAASPEKGKIGYERHCVSCHGADGQGALGLGQNQFQYPPLWGPNSYNDAAGLHRLSNLAKFLKYNMPLGAGHQNPILSNEEAWDIAAYVNSQPRPHFNQSKDWPDIAQKPIDHPFGPFADAFSEKQHKYGPFKPMLAK